MSLKHHGFVDTGITNPVSYAPQVIADSSGQFCGNACRYATPDEADNAARELSSRWMLVRETRVVATSDPVNYRWDPERYRGVNILDAVQS